MRTITLSIHEYVRVKSLLQMQNDKLQDLKKDTSNIDLYKFYDKQIDENKIIIDKLDGKIK